MSNKSKQTTEWIRNLLGKKTKNKDGEGDLLWLQTTNNLVADVGVI